MDNNENIFDNERLNDIYQKVVNKEGVFYEWKITKYY